MPSTRPVKLRRLYLQRNTPTQLRGKFVPSVKNQIAVSFASLSHSSRDTKSLFARRILSQIVLLSISIEVAVFRSSAPNELAFWMTVNSYADDIIEFAFVRFDSSSMPATFLSLTRISLGHFIFGCFTPHRPIASATATAAAKVNSSGGHASFSKRTEQRMLWPFWEIHLLPPLPRPETALRQKSQIRHFSYSRHSARRHHWSTRLKHRQQLLGLFEKF